MMYIWSDALFLSHFNNQLSVRLRYLNVVVKMDLIQTECSYQRMCPSTVTWDDSKSQNNQQISHNSLIHIWWDNVIRCPS